MKEITPIEATQIIHWFNQCGQSAIREKLNQSDTYLKELEIQIIDNWFAPVIIIRTLIEQLSAEERKAMWSFVRARRYRQKQREKIAPVTLSVSKDTAKRLDYVRKKLDISSMGLSDDEVVRYLLASRMDHL